MVIDSSTQKPAVVDGAMIVTSPSIRPSAPNPPSRWRSAVVLAEVIGLLSSVQALATPQLQVLSRERLDRPNQWRVVIKAEQPSSLEQASSSGSGRPLGTYTFRVNCETRWLRDVSQGVGHPPRRLDQMRGYPTGVPQTAFVAACGDHAL
jgi:hypothetical protein